LQAGEFAVATKCTLEPVEALPGFVTVAVAGDDTKTPAKEGNEIKTDRQRTV
jgi:hypothetical protein